MKSRQSAHERCLVVYNPTKTESNRFKHARKQLHHLIHRQALRSEGLATDSKDSKTQDKILQAMKSNDLLVVLGGDGMVNTAATAVLRAEPEHRAVILPARVGTANDFVRNHNGKMLYRGALSRIVERGRVVDIHPVALTVTDQNTGEIQRRIAVNNAGFGFSADAAHLLNQPTHRGGLARRIPFIGQAVQEMITGVRGMQDIATYSSVDLGSQQAIERVDRSIVHARTAAKYGHFATNHLDDKFLELTIEQPTRTAVGIAAVRMMTGTSGGEKQSAIAFVNGNSYLRGQVDGETFDIAPGALVCAELAKESFQTYSLQSF